MVTTAVALIGAGVVAVTPVAAPAPADTAPAVQLTAGFDPLGLWQDVLNTASANFTAIAQDYNETPLPVLQQVIVNQSSFLNDLLNGRFGVLGDMWDNLKAALGAPLNQFIPAADSPISGSLDSSHHTLLALILGALPVLYPGDPAMQQTVRSLLEFASTPAAGWLIGELGVIASPILQFRDDIGGIIGALTGPDRDWTTALQDLINMPANLTGAIVNGYGVVDLLPILDRFGIDLPTPPLTSITRLELDLGGLVSPGGSIFNAISVTVSPRIGPNIVNVDGSPAGPWASLTQLVQAMAQAIGWNTVGNPLTHLELPTIGSAQAADLGDVFPPLSAAFDTAWGDLFAAP